MPKYLHTLKIKPFLTNICILYPLENTKISKFFDILWGGGYKIDPWALTRNGSTNHEIGECIYSFQHSFICKFFRNLWWRILNVTDIVKLENKIKSFSMY